MGRSLIEQYKKLTFADIELNSNLTEKSSKQLANFINDKFDVDDFGINYHSDFNVLTIAISTKNENVYNVQLIIRDDINSKTSIKLIIGNDNLETTLPKNIRLMDLEKLFDELYNELIIKILEY